MVVGGQNFRCMFLLSYNCMKLWRYWIFTRQYMIETYLCAVSPVRGRQVGFLWVCDIPDVVFFIFAQFQFSIWTGTAVWDSVGTKERFETWLPFKLPRGPLATSMGWNNIWSNIFMHLYFSQKYVFHLLVTNERKIFTKP